MGRESFYGPCKMFLGKEAHPHKYSFAKLMPKESVNRPLFLGSFCFVLLRFFQKKPHEKKKKRKIQKQKRKTHHQIIIHHHHHHHHNIRAKVVLLLFAFAQFVRCEWWKKKRRRRALDFFRFDSKSILDSNQSNGVTKNGRGRLRRAHRR